MSKVKRIPDCGHTDKPHFAYGFCRRCYRANNKTLRDKEKQYRLDDPTKYKKHARKWNMKRFGTTIDHYNKLFEAQNGLCAICRNSETVVRNGKVINLSIDHAHACCPTKGSCGKCNRELLCFNCNRVLGCVNDSVDLLKAAITYLEKHKKA